MNLINFLKVNVLGWIARRDNPHQVTAGQAGTYTTKQLDDKLEVKLDVGILPIYAYGPEDNEPIGNTTNGLNCSITLPQPLLLYGRPYTIAPATVTALANQTSYLVVELIGNIPTYVVYNLRPNDTNSRITVGRFEAATAITEAIIKPTRGIVATDAPI